MGMFVEFRFSSMKRSGNVDCGSTLCPDECFRCDSPGGRSSHRCNLRRVILRTYYERHVVNSLLDQRFGVRINRLLGAIAIALVVTAMAAPLQTASALTPPPPGTPPATHTPPQTYTGVATIDGQFASPGTVIVADGRLTGGTGTVGINGNYSLVVPTHHYSLGYVGGGRVFFRVGGLPAAETPTLGIGAAILNLTAITPPSPEQRLAGISSGGGHLCGLRVDGSPTCWSSSRFSPATTPGDERFTAISSGGDYACGLRADGSPVCWGAPLEPLTYIRLTPPDGERFTAISSGGVHICALRNDGSPVCWGENYFDQASPPPGEKFTAISSGRNYACGLRADGSPVCWGGSYWGLDKIPPPKEKLTTVSSGGLSTCGLRPDGSPVCWGAPIGPPPNGEMFTAISTGLFHVCGLRSDGSVACWGGNYEGQALPPLDEKFTAISSGSGFTCGLRSDGSHTCWGDSPYGQAAPPTATPTPMINPTVAPTRVLTPRPTPTPTIIPTAVATPVFTPTPIPAATPTPTPVSMPTDTPFSGNSDDTGEAPPTGTPELSENQNGGGCGLTGQDGRSDRGGWLLLGLLAVALAKRPSRVAFHRNQKRPSAK